MYFKEFPDLKWVQKQAENGFLGMKDAYGNALDNPGWPNVILNVKEGAMERNGIKGPFSIFLNLSGQSHVRTGGAHHKLGTDFYFVSNHGQYYDLGIPRGGFAETFNLHFGDSLYQEVRPAVTNSHQVLLDKGPTVEEVPWEILPKTRWKSPQFNYHLSQILQFCRQSDAHYYPSEREYELMGTLLAYIISENSQKGYHFQPTASIKKSTRLELMRRVSIVVDFIHENASQPITLEHMSQACGLSKFHMLRVFKTIVHCTPQQYLAQIRLLKAKALLSQTSIQAAEIATLVGFSELPAFTRFFKKHTHQSPKAYRTQISNLG